MKVGSYRLIPKIPTWNHMACARRSDKMITGVSLVHETQEQMGMGMAMECQQLSFSPDTNMEQSLFTALSNRTKAQQLPLGQLETGLSLGDHIPLWHQHCLQTRLKTQDSPSLFDPSTEGFRFMLHKRAQVSPSAPRIMSVWLVWASHNTD